MLSTALLAALLVFAPSVAFGAGSAYSIDELSTELYVQPDASTHVVQRQVLTFGGSNRGLVWYLHAPEQGESVRIASVRVAQADDGGAIVGDWQRLQLVDSDPERQGMNPGDSAVFDLRHAGTRPWYSYRIADGMVRAYFPADAGETYAVEVDYIVRNRVHVYRDVGELYWRYADSSLPADAVDVTLQVLLPVPEGAEDATGEEVLAWGHGPDEGTFAVGDDGSVLYHVDAVRVGQYAEAHVVFPASWMSVEPVETALSPYTAELRRAAAIAEESQWLDAAARGALWDNKVRVLFCAIGAAVVLVGALLALRHGRSPRSRRVLVRVACTLAIIAGAEQFFFREPVTTTILAGAALVVGFGALFMPQAEEEPAS